jgi:type I restriction enzyme S subunit
MAMYGATVGKLGIIKSPMTTNQACCVMVPSKNCDYRYLYYQLLINRDEIISRANGAAQQNLNVGKIAAFLLPFPPIDAQRKIAEVLGALDEKIELNRKMNKTLESLAQAVFKKWFIDAADPNWETKKLGDFFLVKTGKKDANFSSENGQYPFFTCSQGHLMADDYSFDCSAILLAGNGDFNIKWYEGKFEAYQRTYVLEPYDKNLLGFLYFAIKYNLNDITAGHRGSVINFLTKGMIENYEINIPNIAELDEKSKIFKIIISKMDFNTRQIETLSRIRDSLLPRLMSGKLRVR